MLTSLSLEIKAALPANMRKLILISVKEFEFLFVFDVLLCLIKLMMIDLHDAKTIIGEIKSVKKNSIKRKVNILKMFRSLKELFDITFSFKVANS